MDRIEYEPGFIYCIYDHPSDFPDYFVVRAWLGKENKGVKAQCDTIEEARARIPMYLTLFERHPADDTKIVESWL